MFTHIHILAESRRGTYPFMLNSLRWHSAIPEFLSPSHAPFYNYPVGAGTPFAEQTSIYAHAIADQLKGGSGDWSLDVQHIADKYTAYYTKPANISRGYASYYDNATKGFLDSPKKLGDTETNAVAHVLPVVILRAGKPGFLKDAEAAIRIIQDTDEAVAFGMTFARILERVILGDGTKILSHWRFGGDLRESAMWRHGPLISSWLR